MICAQPAGRALLTQLFFTGLSFSCCCRHPCSLQLHGRLRTSRHDRFAKAAFFIPLPPTGDLRARFACSERAVDSQVLYARTVFARWPSTLCWCRSADQMMTLNERGGAAARAIRAGPELPTSILLMTFHYESSFHGGSGSSPSCSSAPDSKGFWPREPYRSSLVIHFQSVPQSVP